MVRALKSLLGDTVFPEGDCWTRERYGANETIVRRNEKGDKVYLILDGSVKVLAEAHLGSSTVQSRLTVLNPGEVFGEFCLVDCALRSATVAAHENCEVAAIRRESLIAYCDGNPEFGYRLLRDLFSVIAQRLRQSNERLVDLTTHHMQSVMSRYDPTR